MSRFDESGLFWEPFKYVSQKRQASSSDPRPAVLPPIPDTGWVPKAEFPDLSAARAIGIDIETCDPDLREKGPGVRRGAYIVGVSVATLDGFARYYPLRHSIGENLDPSTVMAWLREQLGRKTQPKIGANLLYDIDFLASEGVEVKGNLYDVQYADPLISEYETSYSLEAIAQRRLGEGKETSILYQWCADAYGGEAGSKQRKNIWRAPSSLVGPYAEKDASLPLRVLKEQVKTLREMGLYEVFSMECRLMPLLLKMRRTGVRVSMERCTELDLELTKKIDELQSILKVDAFSAAQIAEVLDSLQVEYPRTPTGQPSFRRKWLETSGHPFLTRIAKLRRLLKLRDTFVRSALMESCIDGRIHCEFHPLRTDEYGTVSGRYSSTNPNLQQVPARDEEWAPQVRSCLIPDEGYAWMKNDLSQIEFRLGVHFGRGKGIEEVRERYRKDPKTDFYNLCADITGLPRTPSKSIALGTLYGMGVKTMAENTGVELEVASEQFKTFNEALPFMRETYDYETLVACQDGFIRTIGGRICHLQPDYEYKALNRKLQGSCADWMKRSMLLAFDSGIFDVLKLYLTVHDELDSGVPPSKEGAEAATELHRIMCSAYKLKVPVLAGKDFGKNWGYLDEVDTITPELVARFAV